VRDQQRTVLVGRVEPRQDAAEPFLHLERGDAHGVHVDELALEAVRLVHDQQTAPRQLLGVPVAQRREVPRVGAEDRARQRGRLGARVGTLAERAARPAAHAERRRHARLGIALARVVVATLDDLHDVAELALVLVLQQLLRGQQVRVLAPARQRYREMALADASRRLHDEEPRRGRVRVGLGQRTLQRVEQPRLLPSRRESLGEVLDEAHGARSAPPRASVS
jgi:hypothetical protein